MHFYHESKYQQHLGFYPHLPPNSLFSLGEAQMSWFSQRNWYKQANGSSDSACV